MSDQQTTRHEWTKVTDIEFLKAIAAAMGSCDVDHAGDIYAINLSAIYKQYAKAEDDLQAGLPGGELERKTEGLVGRTDELRTNVEIILTGQFKITSAVDVRFGPDDQEFTCATKSALEKEGDFTFADGIAYPPKPKAPGE